jgi:RNA-directed DNA polymerase
MRRFVLGWEKLGLRQSLGSRIVTYTDDLVILCRRGKAEEALHWMREIMGKLKLTVNAEKTRICKVPEGEFDFLGFTFGPMYSPRTGQARLALRPSKKSIRRMIENCSSALHWPHRFSRRRERRLNVIAIGIEHPWAW